MGNYLNPGNSGFTGIRNDIYIDKSGMISRINETIGTPRRLTCAQPSPPVWKIFCGTDAVRLL